MSALEKRYIIAGEAEFLKALDFRLHVTGREFEGWIQLLEGYVATRQSQLTRDGLGSKRTVRKLRCSNEMGVGLGRDQRRNADTPSLSATYVNPSPIDYPPLLAGPPRLRLPCLEITFDKVLDRQSSSAQSSPPFKCNHDRLPCTYSILPTVIHQTSFRPSWKRSFDTAISEEDSLHSSRNCPLNKMRLIACDPITYQLPLIPTPFHTAWPVPTPNLRADQPDSSLLEECPFRRSSDPSPTTFGIPQPVSDTSYQNLSGHYSPLLTYTPPQTSRPEHTSFYSLAAGRRQGIFRQTLNQIPTHSNRPSKPHSSGAFHRRTSFQSSVPNLPLSSSRMCPSDLLAPQFIHSQSSTSQSLIHQNPDTPPLRDLAQPSHSPPAYEAAPPSTCYPSYSPIAFCTSTPPQYTYSGYLSPSFRAPDHLNSRKQGSQVFSEYSNAGEPGIYWDQRRWSEWSLQVPAVDVRSGVEWTSTP